MVAWVESFREEQEEPVWCWTVQIDGQEGWESFSMVDIVAEERDPITGEVMFAGEIASMSYN